MNIPIVFLLGIFSYQLGKALNERPIILFGFAWLVNLIHICVHLFGNYYNDEQSLWFAHQGALLITLDYINTYLFLLAAHIADYSIYKRYGKTLHPIVEFINSFSIRIKYLVLLLFYAASITLYYSRLDSFGIIDLSKIPSVLIGTGALLLISYYFNTLYKREHYLKTIGIENSNLFDFKNEIRYILFGVVMFAFLQLLALCDLSTYPTIKGIGYTLALIIKTIILFGLIRFFVIEAQKLSRTKIITESLSDIVGSIFHELTFPLNEVKKVSIDYENNYESWKMNKHTLKNVEKYENNYVRIRAIVTAFLKLYENLIKSNYNKSFNELFEFSDVNDGYHNLNNLIEICVQNAKTIHGEKVTFEIQYTKNPIFKCQATEFLQMITNLLRNSIDSFNHDNGVIKIKTKKIKFHDKENLNDQILITIEDNGSGISESDRPYIFEKGYSTKPKNEVIKGLGLWYTNKFVEKMKGKIELESPIKGSNEITFNGTKTLIYLDLPK